MYADPFPSNIRHGRLLLMKWQSHCTRKIKENVIKATQQNIKPNQQCKRNSLSLLSLYRSKSTEFTNHSCVWNLQEEAKWRNKIRSISEIEMVKKSQASDSKCWFVITSDCDLWHVRKLTATQILNWAICSETETTGFWRFLWRHNYRSWPEKIHGVFVCFVSFIKQQRQSSINVGDWLRIWNKLLWQCTWNQIHIAKQPITLTLRLAQVQTQTLRLPDKQRNSTLKKSKSKRHYTMIYIYIYIWLYVYISSLSTHTNLSGQTLVCL